MEVVYGTQNKQSYNEYLMTNNLPRIKSLFFPLKPGDRVVVTHVNTSQKLSVHTGRLGTGFIIFKPGDTGTIKSILKTTGSCDCVLDTGRQWYINKNLLGKLSK